MHTIEKIVEKIDLNKSYIWGGFLASTITGFAVSNIFLGILLLCFFFQLFTKKKIQFKREYFPIILYFLWGTSSLLWSTNINNTSSGISKSIYLLIVPLLISQYTSFSIKDLKDLIRTLSVFLLLYFILSFFHSLYLYLNDFNFTHFYYHNLTAIFNNNAIYISLLTSICILVLLFTPSKTKLDYCMLMVLIVYLLLLSSKNLIVTTFVISIIAFIISNRKALNSTKSLVLFLCISFGISIFFIFDNPIRNRFFGEFYFNFHEIWYKNDFLTYEFNGTSIRLFQWRIVWEMIENGQVGILGLGWNNVNYLIYQYFDYYNFYKGNFSINFHNQYLQTFGELGLGGLFFLLVILVKCIISGIKRNLYLLLFTITASLSFVTESILSRQKGVLIFIIFYCLFYHLNLSTVLSNKKRE